MDAKKQRSRLHKQIAFLPGSRDRARGPILVINPAGNQNGRERAAGPSVSVGTPSYEDIVSLVGYLAQIPDEETRRHGFTVLIDGRRAQLKHLRNALRACQHVLYRQIRQAIIVQPERFLEQQKLNFDLIKEAYEFKTTLTSPHKLSKYVDVMQLPESLGGTLSYDAEKWTDMRERYENFIVKASNWIQISKRHEKNNLNESGDSVDSSHRTVATPEDLLKKGDELLDDLLPSDAGSLQSANSDWAAAAQKVESLLKEIKAVEEAPALEAKRAQQNAANANSAKLLDDHAQGVRSLLDWIFGAGEKWLLTLHETGESVDDARQLVKDHSQLEVKAKEVVEQAVDLSEMANRLVAEFPASAATLDKSREHLNSVVRTFRSRVDRQKRIAVYSIRFHQTLNEFSHKTDLLLETLCTEVKAADIASAEKEKNEMEKKVDEMEKIYQSLIESGLAFIDELCVDESNCFGRPVVRDYSAGIVHVRERLEETRDRRRRCQDLVDVRRLKVQQLLQLYTCEKDGNQAIKWIDELHSTLLNDYDEVGCGGEEVRTLREDRLKLEETARSTYEYGKQLCQVALVLRRSLRMEVQPQLALNQRLESAWGRLCRALSENEAKLNISDAFHSTVKEVSNRLDDLCLKVSEHMMENRLGERAPNASLHSLNNERKCLANDARELKHIADVLVEQLDTKSARTKQNPERLNAVQEIRRKLAQVEEKQRKLENLWLNGVCLSPQDGQQRTTLPRKKSPFSGAPLSPDGNGARSRHVRIAPQNGPSASSDSSSPMTSPRSQNSEHLQERQHTNS